MPVWNDKLKRYDEEKIELFTKRETSEMEREERFRTALLNELDGIAHAILRLETPS